MSLTSETVQALLDGVSDEILQYSDNNIIKQVLYSTQIGMTYVLDLLRAREGTSPTLPNKGSVCSYIMQNLGKTGTTKSITDGTAYRFDKQWFRDNLQHGTMDIRTVYYLTEECSGVIFVVSGSAVNFEFVENDQDGSQLAQKWSSLS